MQFGKKRSEVVQYSGDYVRNIRAGETKVRFLDEVKDWVMYREHFLKDEGQTRSFPCTENRSTCPGCTHSDPAVVQAPRKYAVNALVVDEGRVLPLRLPVRLVETLEARSDRNDGTIRNRDYMLYRSGQGLNTTYDVEQGKEYEVDFTQYQKEAKNIQELLAKSFAEVWGSPEDAAQKTETKAKSADTLQRLQAELKAKQESQSEEPPFDQPAEVDEEFTEAQIRAMNNAQLDALYEAAGLQSDPWMGEHEKANELIARLKQ